LVAAAFVYAYEAGDQVDTFEGVDAGNHFNYRDGVLMEYGDIFSMDGKVFIPPPDYLIL